MLPHGLVILLLGVVLLLTYANSFHAGFTLDNKFKILEDPRIPAEIDYLIVGPFATQTQVFVSALAQRNHRLLVSEGSYQLFQLY